MKLEPSRFYYLQQKVQRTVKRVRERSKIKEEEKKILLSSIILTARIAVFLILFFLLQLRVDLISRESERHTFIYNKLALPSAAVKCIIFF